MGSLCSWTSFLDVPRVWGTHWASIALTALSWLLLLSILLSFQYLLILSLRLILSEHLNSSCGSKLLSSDHRRSQSPPAAGRGIPLFPLFRFAVNHSSLIFASSLAICVLHFEASTLPSHTHSDLPELLSLF
ncbi:hypothetical protein BDW68DRAFT_71864 [Aspergillus falconensis]